MRRQRSAWSPTSSTTNRGRSDYESDDRVVLDGVFASDGSPGHLDLGEAEYALRSAVRSAADALGAIRAAGADVADPRELVEQVLEAAAATGCPTTPRRGRCGCWRTPPTSTRSSPSAPADADRLQTSSEVQIANDALRPLAAVVRSARMAAVSAILYSAWN